MTYGIQREEKKVVVGVLPHPDRCVSYGKTCQGSRARDGKRMGKDNRSVHYEADHLCAGALRVLWQCKVEEGEKNFFGCFYGENKAGGFLYHAYLQNQWPYPVYCSEIKKEKKESILSR